MVEIPTICRYCGGAVHLVPAAKVYGPAAAKRLGLEREKFYQCQNCNARVGCHKGSARPLGNLANEALRMKRMETHQVFDSFWKERGMSRTQGYKWMAKKLRLSEELAHIGGFEMDRCQKLIRLFLPIPERPTALLCRTALHQTLAANPGKCPFKSTK